MLLVQATKASRAPRIRSEHWRDHFQSNFQILIWSNIKSGSKPWKTIYLFQQWQEKGKYNKKDASQKTIYKDFFFSLRFTFPHVDWEQEALIHVNWQENHGNTEFSTLLPVLSYCLWSWLVLWLSPPVNPAKKTNIIKMFENSILYVAHKQAIM